jgi:hypothetical protein
MAQRDGAAVGRLGDMGTRGDETRGFCARDDAFLGATGKRDTGIDRRPWHRPAIAEGALATGDRTADTGHDDTDHDTIRFCSTVAEVANGIDLSGKRAIVTGAALGIGVETAQAAPEAAVTLAVRNVEVGVFGVPGTGASRTGQRPSG